MMEKTQALEERREFVRYKYKKPLHYSVISTPKDKNLISKFANALSKDISASGILFTTDAKDIPEASSLVILDLDRRTSKICAELEKNALIINNKLMGTVTRLDKKENQKTDVGVAFVTKSDRLSEDIKKLV